MQPFNPDSQVEITKSLLLGLLGTPQQTRSPGRNETRLLTLGGIPGDCRCFTDMLMVTLYGSRQNPAYKVSRSKGRHLHHREDGRQGSWQHRESWASCFASRQTYASRGMPLYHVCQL